MKSIKLHGKTGDCNIILGRSIQFKDYINTEKSVIITDVNVNHFYSHLISEYKIIEIGTGEEIKTLNTVEKIYKKFVEYELDRSSFITGIGGGIVCDITGFASSTYMRGIPFGFIPSTLLSQVDASIGGKNGVNFDGYKNLIGVFNQPSFCLCDINLLKTLPEREIKCGLAEIIKHGAIGNNTLFSYIEKNIEKALFLDEEIIEKLIYESLIIKSEIVTIDETEKGERRKLNFGHTLGHGIEKVTGLPHGEAISTGMAIAADFSVSKGLLNRSKAERLKSIIKNAGLPVKLVCNYEAILEAVKKDKKREGQSILMCLLEDMGKARIVDIKIEELKVFLSNYNS